MKKFIQELEEQIGEMKVQAQQLEGFHNQLKEQKRQASENYEAALTVNRGDLSGIMNIP